jgi:hypothetical protein
VEDALAGTDSERAARRNGGRLRLLAVRVASDIRARRATSYEVIALGVLDLSNVLPFDCVLAGARDKVREVICRRLVSFNGLDRIEVSLHVQWAWTTPARNRAAVTICILTRGIEKVSLITPIFSTQ